MITIACKDPLNKAEVAKIVPANESIKGLEMFHTAIDLLFP